MKKPELCGRTQTAVLGNCSIRKDKWSRKGFCFHRRIGRFDLRFMFAEALWSPGIGTLHRGVGRFHRGVVGVW